MSARRQARRMRRERGRGGRSLRGCSTTSSSRCASSQILPHPERTRAGSSWRSCRPQSSPHVFARLRSRCGRCFKPAKQPLRQGIRSKWESGRGFQSIWRRGHQAGRGQGIPTVGRAEARTGGREGRWAWKRRFKGSSRAMISRRWGELNCDRSAVTISGSGKTSAKRSMGWLPRRRAPERLLSAPDGRSPRSWSRRRRCETRFA